VKAVAPHTGAWIETECSALPSRPPRVAPHTGAWIETCAIFGLSQLQASRPIRARGLKLGDAVIHVTRESSRPIRARGLKQHHLCPDPGQPRRAPYGRVD